MLWINHNPPFPTRRAYTRFEFDILKLAEDVDNFEKLEMPKKIFQTPETEFSSNPNYRSQPMLKGMF